MLSSASLFSLSLLATGGLYACMLAYFGGLVGTKRHHTRIVWNSEPLLWIITLLLTFTVTFKVVQPVESAGPGIWYLIGVGNLMIIYIYLIIELARHDLPKMAYWATGALCAAAVIYMAASIVMALMSQMMDLIYYKQVLATLFAALTHILMLVLAFNLLRSFGSSLMNIWMADPNARKRLTAGGISSSFEGNVENPDAALSDITLESSAESESATLLQGGSLVIDFGARRIEDHGFRSDLRIIGSDTDQHIDVDVSNDGETWEACEREEKILTDWDVPYFNSPWRYVRISNQGSEPVYISEVYDLD